MWLLKFALVVAAVYLVIVAALFFGQARMIFPRGMVAAPDAPPPAAAERLTMATADGETIVGLRIPPAVSLPADRQAGKPLTIIGFGGNAWHADGVADFLHGLYPAATVVAFHYRGYAPSTGEPGATVILADALAIYDQVAAGAASGDIVLVGFSLGSAVATSVAAARPVAGAIFVSPFDSMGNLAQAHYPWLPAKWLLRHRFPAADWARDVTAPVALIAAGNDTLVPPDRTAPLRDAFGTIVYDRTIARAGHIDIYTDPAFEAAMREALAKVRE